MNHTHTQLPVSRLLVGDESCRDSFPGIRIAVLPRGRSRRPMIRQGSLLCAAFPETATPGFSVKSSTQIRVGTPFTPFEISVELTVLHHRASLSTPLSE